MPDIDKNLLNRLAKLSRVDISGDESDMLEDFGEIVDYFEKLNELDIESVESVSGGSDIENSWREDGENGDKRIMSEETFTEFPEQEDGYNKIPPVF